MGIVTLKIGQSIQLKKNKGIFTMDMDTLIMIARLQRSYTGNLQVDPCIP